MDFSVMKSRLGKALSDFMYGFTTHSHLQTIRKQLVTMDFTFMALLFGDMLGIPMIPPIYKYRLLPKFFLLIERWKEEMLKEKDFFEKISESS